MFMQKLNSNDYLSEHISNSVLGEDEILFSGIEIEITFRQVLHDDVNIFFVLEDLVYACKKRMFTNGGN